jgi:glycosyltransferase involved in cell wall biosynthesis
VRAARPARLLILGEGKERPQLQAHLEKLGLQDCVQMPGRGADDRAWFASARTFSCSRPMREGLPAVLIEAMSVGTR